MGIKYVTETKVRDVMTPGPIGVDYYQSIGEAARTMRDWGIGAVLVVNDQDLHGLITDRDLVVRAVAEAKSPDEAVGPLSTADLIGVDVDAGTAEAARLMRKNSVRRLPVIEDGQVAGIVSLGDLAMHDPAMDDDPACTLAAAAGPADHHGAIPRRPDGPAVLPEERGIPTSSPPSSGRTNGAAGSTPMSSAARGGLSQATSRLAKLTTQTGRPGQ